MSETANVPTWLMAKSGEAITQKFRNWINQNQQRLLRTAPPAEEEFFRVLCKMCSRLPKGWRRRLHCTRQKYFVISDSVVFFGDFYFRNARLLIEVDGPSHYSPAAKEKDAWRSKLISSCRRTKTARINNESIIGCDFRDVERWIIDQLCRACPPYIKEPTEGL